jgi:hypothetical protein
MTHPQQPELHRSNKGETTQDGRQLRTGGPEGGQAHGTDKGDKGGGRGGGVPPEQQPDHPV